MKYKIPLIVSYALLTTPLFSFTDKMWMNADEYELVRNETITQGSADMQVQEPEAERLSQSDFLVSIPYDAILEEEEKPSSVLIADEENAQNKADESAHTIVNEEFSTFDSVMLKLETLEDILKEMSPSMCAQESQSVKEFNKKLQGFYRRDIIALHYLLHHTYEKDNVKKTIGLIDETLVDVRDNYIEASYVDPAIYFPYVYMDLKYLTSQKTDYKTKLETYFEANPNSTLVLYTYAQMLQCSVRALPSTCRHFSFVGPYVKKIQHSCLSAKLKPGSGKKQKLLHEITQQKEEITFDFAGLSHVKSVGKKFMNSWHNVRQLDFRNWENVRAIGEGFAENCWALMDLQLGRSMISLVVKADSMLKSFEREINEITPTLTNEARDLETVIAPKVTETPKEYLLAELVRDFAQELQAQTRVFLNSPEFPMLCLTIAYTCFVYLLDEVRWKAVD